MKIGVHIFAALAVLVLFISGNIKEVKGEFGEADELCRTPEDLPACLQGICGRLCKDKYGSVGTVIGQCSLENDSVCNCVHPC